MAMKHDRKASCPHKGQRLPFSSKKAFELQFHWIFILVAGGLILAFFFTVAHRQQALSTERLQLTLATDIENIFTGAIVSKGTAQRLPVPPQGIRFECNEGCACEFKIDKAVRPFGDKPMFAPDLLEDQDIVVWALEFKLPYRVTNFLYLTNPNIKYYFISKTGDGFSENLRNQLTKNLPPLIDYENLTLQEMASAKYEGYQQTKFILLNVDPADLDDSFEDEEASAIKIDQNGIAFYEKDGTRFQTTKFSSYVGMTSMYAAMFAQDATMYDCSMKIAFKKLGYISQIYAERAAELQQQSLESGKAQCDYGAPAQTTNICAQSVKGATALLCDQNKLASQLSSKLDLSIIGRLDGLKQSLENANRNLVQYSCPEIF